MVTCSQLEESKNQTESEAPNRVYLCSQPSHQKYLSVDVLAVAETLHATKPTMSSVESDRTLDTCAPAQINPVQFANRLTDSTLSVLSSLPQSSLQVVHTSDWLEAIAGTSTLFKEVTSEVTRSLYGTGNTAAVSYVIGAVYAQADEKVASGEGLQTQAQDMPSFACGMIKRHHGALLLTSVVASAKPENPGAVTRAATTAAVSLADDQAMASEPILPRGPAVPFRRQTSQQAAVEADEVAAALVPPRSCAQTSSTCLLHTNPRASQKPAAASGPAAGPTSKDDQDNGTGGGGVGGGEGEGIREAPRLACETGVLTNAVVAAADVILNGTPGCDLPCDMVVAAAAAAAAAPPLGPQSPPLPSEDWLTQGLVGRTPPGPGPGGKNLTVGGPELRQERMGEDLDPDLKLVLGLRLGMGSCPDPDIRHRALRPPALGSPLWRPTKLDGANAIEVLDNTDMFKLPALRHDTSITVPLMLSAGAAIALSESEDHIWHLATEPAAGIDRGGSGDTLSGHQYGISDAIGEFNTTPARGSGERRRRRLLLWRRRGGAAAATATKGSTAASQPRPHRGCQAGYRHNPGATAGPTSAWALENGLRGMWVPGRSSAFPNPTCGWPPDDLSVHTDIFCGLELSMQSFPDFSAARAPVPHNLHVPTVFRPYIYIANDSTGDAFGGISGGGGADTAIGTDYALISHEGPQLQRLLPSLPPPQWRPAAHLADNPRRLRPASTTATAAAAAQRLVQAVLRSVQAILPVKLLCRAGATGYSSYGGGGGGGGGRSTTAATSTENCTAAAAPMAAFGGVTLVQSLDDPILEAAAAASTMGGPTSAPPPPLPEPDFVANVSDGGGGGGKGGDPLDSIGSGRGNRLTARRLLCCLGYP